MASASMYLSSGWIIRSARFGYFQGLSKGIWAMHCEIVDNRTQRWVVYTPTLRFGYMDQETAGMCFCSNKVLDCRK